MTWTVNLLIGFFANMDYHFAHLLGQRLKLFPLCYNEGISCNKNIAARPGTLDGARKRRKLIA